ncbi:hypothetical protein HYH02_006374 [Chlamydomonas schloesseri]|uniref:Peptide-methionine (R)-S-oxide reductase n=1 Tax=Chlamydomonas schloesseri TaxID=2026947 RepID=A0A835WIY2_9CHLO|nr:hypothetical protein HYH02_006374 [Chlamydomonas schloesseri]|eukprot:KAG2448483.1 hypothetical protein HYH02_006374 [Chlamydomonas schloesseri]
MQHLAAKKAAMRSVFGSRGPARAVHAKAGASEGHASASGRTAALPRRVILGAGLATALVAVPLASSGPDSRAAAASPADGIDLERRLGEVRYSEAEWRERLGPAAYDVLRREATERRWTSPYNFEKRAGTFKCAGCGSPLFDASTKFESGTGWPSFFQPLPGAVAEVSDYSIIFMPRTEVRCRKCQGHLGHVFDDGPAPTGLRYCMNGLALSFEPVPGA